MERHAQPRTNDGSVAPAADVCALQSTHADVWETPRRCYGVHVALQAVHEAVCSVEGSKWGFTSPATWNAASPRHCLIASAELALWNSPMT